jgi:hypothetical protein
MASRNYHKRRAKERKIEQAERAYVEALRRQAVRYEHVTERSAARMSKERLEETIRHGKLRKGLTGAPIGLLPAEAFARLAAAQSKL